MSRASLVTTAPGLGAFLMALALMAPDVSARRHAAFTDRASQEAEGGRKSVRDGVYSPAQAERGDQIFKEKCAACHQPAEFTTPAFMQAWAGQTADSLFEVIRTKMPTDNPGSLRRQEYADLLAYLFKLNGLPAGDAELKGTAGALKQVLIETPHKPARSTAGTR